MAASRHKADTREADTAAANRPGNAPHLEASAGTFFLNEARSTGDLLRQSEPNIKLDQCLILVSGVSTAVPFPVACFLNMPIRLTQEDTMCCAAAQPSLLHP